LDRRSSRQRPRLGTLLLQLLLLLLLLLSLFQQISLQAEPHLLWKVHLPALLSFLQLLLVAVALQ
jgi:hypothetical protein